VKRKRKVALEIQLRFMIASLKSE